MRATILTDASWCPRTEVAGYGYWIASDRGKLGGGGVVQGVVTGSIAAEMMAVANALWFAVMNDLVQAGDRVLVQTDCVSGIQAFENTRQTLSRQEAKARSFVWDYSRQHGFYIEYRHVKGHTRKRDPRFVANHMCDQRAREHMLAARAAAEEQHA